MPERRQVGAPRLAHREERAGLRVLQAEAQEILGPVGRQDGDIALRHARPYARRLAGVFAAPDARARLGGGQAGEGRGVPVRHRAPYFNAFVIGIDQIAGLVFRRVDDRDLGRVAELVERLAGDVAVLHGEEARLVPLAVRPVAEISQDGVKFVAVEPLGDLVLIEALRARDALGQDLGIGIGRGRGVVAQGSTPSPGAWAWYFFSMSSTPGNISGFSGSQFS